MTTAANLIADLLEGGMSKSELARRSGVSRSLIDDYLSGRCQPSVRQLDRLGAAASRKLDLSWRPVESEPPPTWTRPPNTMTASPLTVAERAQVLRRVAEVAMAFRKREPGTLAFPPFRTLLVARDS